MYEKELKAIKRANRFRKREIFNLIDLASNDYLGLANNKDSIKKTCKEINEIGAKASQLVNGYTLIHKKLEDFLKKESGFEEAILVGSGFLANLVLESLVRKEDILLMDEKFHASGILASRLVKNKAFFRHNDLNDLKKLIEKNKDKKRIIVAVEGIYSMDGDLVKKEILEIKDKFENVYIYLDEAHSVGVIGDNLMGVLNLYKINNNKVIKMGTLSKAIGSYGAYILATKEIISFLENRAKSIIYSTAISNFDTLFSYYNFLYLKKYKDFFKKEIEKRKKLVKEILDKKIDSLILKIEFDSISLMQKAAKKLKENGFLVGAIRPPTVNKPILRIILRVGVRLEEIKRCLKLL